MIKLQETTEYIIFREINTGQSYAIYRTEIPALNKHFSDWDHFLYAPDDLLVEATPISINKRGLILFDHDKKASIKVRNLKLTWTSIEK